MASRLIVRPVVFSWFNGQVAGITTLYNAQPKSIPENAILPSTGVGYGAAGFIDFGDESERRIALGGPTSGKKLYRLETFLVLKFMSVLPKAEDGIVQFDTIIDAAKTRLRADRSLGGNVYQAGEGHDGGPDIEVIGEAPKVEGNGTVHAWAALKWITEMIITS